MEVISQCFDTVAGTNESRQPATSEIFITKHWELEPFQLDDFLKTAE